MARRKSKTKEELLYILRTIGIKKGYRKNVQEDWYGGISVNDIECENITGFDSSSVTENFGTLNNVVRALFPNYNFLEWKFNIVSQGYWNNKNNVIEFLKWIEQIEKWNGPDDWYKIDKALINKHASILLTKYSCLELCGILYSNYVFLKWKFKSVPNGFWQKKENHLQYMEWLQQKMGWYFPEDWYFVSYDTFNRNGGDTLVAMKGYLYCVQLLYPDFKFDMLRFSTVPKGFWNDFENLKKYLLPECVKRGCMPTKEELRLLGLYGAIKKFGGVKAVGDIVGFQTSVHYGAISGNIVKSLSELVVDNFLYLNDINFDYENKIIDDKNFLYDFKVGDIFIEVWGYYGKRYNSIRKQKEEIYKQNQLKLISLDSNVFRMYKLQDINSKLISLMIENNIKKDNFYNDDLHKLLHYTSHDIGSVVKILKEFCVQNNITKMPFRTWWDNSVHKNNIYFLKRRGKTMIDIADLLGFLHSTPYHFYDNFENLRKDLLLICVELNDFPTGEQLKTIGKSHLIDACTKHGGSIKVAELMGYNIFSRNKGNKSNKS